MVVSPAAMRCMVSAVCVQTSQKFCVMGRAGGVRREQVPEGRVELPPPLVLCSVGTKKLKRRPPLRGDCFWRALWRHEEGSSAQAKGMRQMLYIRANICPPGWFSVSVSSFQLRRGFFLSCTCSFVVLYVDGCGLTAPSYFPFFNCLSCVQLCLAQARPCFHCC